MSGATGAPSGVWLRLIALDRGRAWPHDADPSGRVQTETTSEKVVVNQATYLEDTQAIEPWVSFLKNNEKPFPVRWFWDDSEQTTGMAPVGAMVWSRSKVYQAMQGMGIQCTKHGKVAMIAPQDAAELVICLTRFSGNPAEYAKAKETKVQAKSGHIEAKKPAANGELTAVGGPAMSNLFRWKKAAESLAWFADQGIPIQTKALTEALGFDATGTITKRGESFEAMGFEFERVGSFDNQLVWSVRRVQRPSGHIHALPPAEQKESARSVGFVQACYDVTAVPVVNLPRIAPQC